MATLNDQDYGQIREALYRKGVGKEELKALGSLPSKAQLKAAFQSMENDTVASFSSVKSNMDTALGVTTTTTLAQKLYAAYLRWKINKLLGI